MAQTQLAHTADTIASRIVLVTEVLFVFTACGQSVTSQTLTPTILEGQEFGHFIQGPARLGIPGLARAPFWFDHYAFRLSHSSQAVLLAAACGYQQAVHVLDPDVGSRGQPGRMGNRDSD
jgi:hypothetical protein